MGSGGQSSGLCFPKPAYGTFLPEISLGGSRYSPFLSDNPYDQRSLYPVERKTIRRPDQYAFYPVRHLIRQSGSTETFDEFLYWGEMLLNDFDDIDKYMANARMLFSNVTDLREIENDFDFLSDEQIAAIRSFWSSFYPRGDTPNQQQFLAVWQVLYDLYEEFRATLAAEGKGYEGMIFREVVESMERGESPDLPYEQIVFVGLNALSVSEERFLAQLQKGR